MLEPGSVQDIARVIRFANKHDLRVAVRGHGHSIYGQSLVQGGIVIAMSSLAEARNLPGARVLADAGCSWGMVLQETLKEGATPAVIPDYLELSVGGTLSIGGISPTTYEHGAMVDNVEALQVLTGEGHIVTCSRHHREDLFDAMLAGQGQCGVLARAVIKLLPAPARVRACAVLYPDVATALSDADRLVDEKRFDGIVLFTFADGNGGNSVVLPASGATQFIESVLPRLAIRRSWRRARRTAARASDDSRAGRTRRCRRCAFHGNRSSSASRSFATRRMPRKSSSCSKRIAGCSKRVARWAARYTRSVQ